MVCTVKDILSTLKLQMETQTFTDFTIVNNSQSIQVHRNLIAASSGYFKALLSNCVKENIEKSVQFNFDSNSFDIILNYFYSGIIDLNIDNIKGILEISHYLQVDPVIIQCDDFLSSYLRQRPSSPLLKYIYLYKMKISPDNIVNNIKSKLCSIFDENLEHYVFLNMDYLNLHNLIENRQFKANNEYDIVKAIIMWIQNDISNRLKYAESLFDLIHCRLCNKSLMLQNKQIDTNSIELNKIIHQLHIKISILNDPITKDLIQLYDVNTIEAIKVPKDMPTQTIENKSLFNVTSQGICNVSTNEMLLRYNFGEVSRVIYTTNELLFIISFSEGKMYKYHISTNNVEVCSYPSDYRFYYNTPPTVNEVSGGRLVTIGGCRSSGVVCNIVKYYDISNDSWSTCQHLPYDVRAHATVVDGDDIYVIGGIDIDIYAIGGYDDGRNVINKVIRYRNGSWHTLSPLLNTRCRHVAVLNNKCIYVYGGDYKTNGECYNISTGQWSVINSDVYNNIYSNSSVIDEDKHLLYTQSDNNVYSISLETHTKSLLYNNVPRSTLVLMNV